MSIVGPVKDNGNYWLNSRYHDTLTCFVLQNKPKENYVHEMLGTDYLKCANNVSDRRMIELKWYTGEEMLFPYIFLRDSCQCESCYHPFTKARLILMKDLKVDSFPINIQARIHDSTFYTQQEVQS